MKRQLMREYDNILRQLYYAKRSLMAEFSYDFDSDGKRIFFEILHLRRHAYKTVCLSLEGIRI